MEEEEEGGGASRLRYLVILVVKFAIVEPFRRRSKQTVQNDFTTRGRGCPTLLPGSDPKVTSDRRRAL